MLKVLLFLCLIQTFGIILFLRGYLLTRTVISEYSSACAGNETVCIPRRFQRVVWLLVDALRYDFVSYNSSRDTDAPFYINKMLNVKDFLTQHPHNTRLFRFIADPPTTTMQRLKALTTGTLPTFIDIGSNFNSYEIQEDNLIRQCKRNNQTVTFLGDDTWLGMYPHLFDKSYPFPSLNVKDLDTVDEGVYKHIIPELKKHTANFIIGHFLGVDHCGHTHGPNNRIMRDKLIYIDKVIRSVFEAVDNETVVFVFGDHGMTSTGDHGGETDQETEAALLVYSPQPLFGSNKYHSQSVYQTDLVPTVSLLLGLPIPFSNLGMIIPELFLDFYDNLTSLHSQSHRMTFISALRANSQQISRFIEAQSQLSSDLPIQEVNALQEMFMSVEKMYLDVFGNEKYDNEKLKDIKNLYITYIRNVRKLCSLVWAQFDTVKMNSGILVLFLHLLIVLTALVGFRSFSVAKINWIDAVSLIITLLHSLALFSNSFVVYEGNMVTFLSQSLHLTLLVAKVRETLSHTATLNFQAIHQLYIVLKPFVIVMACVRLTSYFHICRDQQEDYCFIPPLLQQSEMLLYSDDPSKIFLYIARFLVSFVAFAFALSYVTQSLEALIKLRCHWYTWPRYMNWLVKCSFVLAFIGIYPSEVVSVWLFRLYMAGTLMSITWTIQTPIASCDSDIQRMPINKALVPYSLILLILWIPMCLIVKATSDVLFLPLSFSIVQFVHTVSILHTMPQVSLFARAVVCSLFSYQFFFGFGHQATVTSLRFEAAFVGLYGDFTAITLPIAGVLVAVNTLGSQIMSSLVIPLLLPTHIWQSKQKVILFFLYYMQLFYILLGSLKLLCTALVAMMLRRHLMIWAVFGPRFLYQAAFQSVLNFFTVLCYLLMSYYTKLSKANKEP